MSRGAPLFIEWDLVSVCVSAVESGMRARDQLQHGRFTSSSLRSSAVFLFFLRLATMWPAPYWRGTVSCVSEVLFFATRPSTKTASPAPLPYLEPSESQSTVTQCPRNFRPSRQKYLRCSRAGDREKAPPPHRAQESIERAGVPASQIASQKKEETGRFQK